MARVRRVGLGSHGSTGAGRARRACWALSAATVSPMVGSLMVAAPSPADASYGDVEPIAGGSVDAGLQLTPIVPVPADQASLSVYATKMAVSGNSIYVRDLDEIVRVDLASGTARRIAGTFPGTGTPIQDGVGLDAASVEFNWGQDIVVAANGDVYFTDNSDPVTGPARIYRIDAATRTLEVAVGDGTEGDTGDGGPAQDASISHDSDGSLWMDASGALWFLQGGRGSLRMVTSGEIIHTVAGDGTDEGDPIGIGVPATTTALPGVLWGLAPDGHFYGCDNDTLLRLDGAGVGYEWSVVGSSPQACENAGYGWAWFTPEGSFDYLYYDDSTPPVRYSTQLATGLTTSTPVAGLMAEVLTDADTAGVGVQASDYLQLDDGGVLFTGSSPSPDGTLVRIMRWDAAVTPNPPVLPGVPYVWGGQPLGNGYLPESDTARPVLGPTDAVAVATAEEAAFALLADGSVWSWGRDSSGLLGDGSDIDQSVPTRVAGLSDVEAIDVGQFAGLALRTDGSLWSWGTGLGLGRPGPDLRPAPVALPSPVVDVDVTEGGTGDHAVALTADGDVWVWGANYLGELGDGGTADQHSPERLAALSDLPDASVVAVAADGIRQRHA